ALDEPSRAEPPEAAAPAGVRGRIVEIARRYVGRPFRGDCSGYVTRVLREAEVSLPPLPPGRSMSESLHLASREVDRPEPGDLVFFHDTYDRNRDGKLGDKWTHVALVEAVEGDRIWILHRGGRRIVRIVMDRSRPADAAANDPVRPQGRRDPRGTKYLAAELFAGYGAVVDSRVSARVSDP
ncbi:MAG: NlpC/P60 family protein, partial [Anaeromyxobacteraceae bacterium]